MSVGLRVRGVLGGMMSGVFVILGCASGHGGGVEGKGKELSGMQVGMRAGWGEEPVEELSGTRGRVCLNGVWYIMPAEGEAREAPRGEWGEIYVPGSWKKTGAPYFVRKGGGPVWARVDDVNRCWYARRVMVPAGWRGSALVLDFRRVSTDAEVYVNGRWCGRVAWPSGEVDVTEAVGEETNFVLVVRVIATADAGLVANYMGHDQVTMEEPRLESKGIIGDVFLVRRPRGARIDDVFVKPSVRRKELAVEVRFEGTREGEGVEVEVTCVETNGVIAKRFSGRGAIAGGEHAVMTVRGAWEDPILWEYGAPYLYVARVKARGAGWEDEYVQEFGFRECWIEGRDIYLNGKLFRLRPVLFEDEWVGLSMAAFEGRINGYMAAGFNIAELWPWDAHRRGRLSYRENICEVASRLGMPLMGPGPSMNDYLRDAQYRVLGWDEVPGKRSNFLARARAEVRRYRDYAAVVMWSCSANFFGNDNDQDPRMLGMTNVSSVNEFKLRAAAGLDGLRMLKEIDPTRLWFTHHGSYVGEMHTCNMYLNMIPLQEREEWLSAWATNGVLPYCAIEFGTPLDATFMRGRNGFGRAIATEPFVSEYCAIYQGVEAYRGESAAYRRAIAERFVSNQVYRSWQWDLAHIETPNFQALQSLFIRNTWRAWRTWGLSGGMLPWMLGHGWRDDDAAREMVYVGKVRPGVRGPQAEYVRRGDLERLRLASTILPAGRTLLEVNGPVLGWIAGSAEAFTEKGHNYRAGEELKKQVVLINDAREPQEYRVAWQVEMGGVCVEAGTNEGKLMVGEVRKIAVNAPLLGEGVGSNEAVRGVVRMEGVIGAQVVTDSLVFKVFGPSDALNGEVQVFDPEGKTRRMLEAVGLRVVDVRKPLRAGPRVLVIGRKALSAGNDGPVGLREFVRDGGRVMVCAQDPEWTRHALGLRVGRHLARRVYRVSARHSVVAGLEDEDLRDWRGESTLVEGYPEYPGFEGYFSYGWRWGNRGGVSSCAIEKPHRGSWRPLLECEFDLAYTPLMEMEYGRGRVTLCTLDLEDHFECDPAAERLAKQVLKHVIKGQVRGKARQVEYVGGKEDEEFLRRLGVVFTRVDRPSAVVEVVVVGRDGGVAEDVVEGIARRGGYVVYLRREGVGPHPHGVRLEWRGGFVGSLEVPEWGECAGLSASDLRWRAEHGAWVVGGGSGVEVGAGGMLGRVKCGGGAIIFCQIDPRWLPADEKTYFRLTRWRQTRALSQILANVGVRFQQDERFMRLLERPDHPVMLAGMWDVQLTDPQVESPRREWRSDRGISSRARELIAAGVGGTGWEEKPVPAYMESYGPAWSWADGEAVFRKIIELPERMRGRTLELAIGRADQKDTTFFNGKKVGETDDWFKPRRYRVPGALVQGGTNVIVVRLFDGGIHGGLCSSPEKLYVRPLRGPDRFYHDDYLPDYLPEEFELGDDPYRYYRW